MIPYIVPAMLMQLWGASGPTEGLNAAAEPECSASLTAQFDAVEIGESRAALLLKQLESASAVQLECFRQYIVTVRPQVPWLQQRSYDAVSADILVRQRRFEEAVTILEPMTGHQHHTLSIPARFHTVLGDAYRALGRDAEAGGQWRLAVAALEDETNATLQASELAARMAALPPLASNGLMPIDAPNPHQDHLELNSIDADHDERRYNTLLLLAQDEADGTAAVRAYRTINCVSGSYGVMARETYDANGQRLRRIEGSGSPPNWDALSGQVSRVACMSASMDKSAAPDIAAAVARFRSSGLNP